MTNTPLRSIANDVLDIEDREYKILYIIVNHLINNSDSENGDENAGRILDYKAQVDSMVLGREFRKTESMIQINGMDVEDKYNVKKYLEKFAKYLGIEFNDSDIRSATFLYPFDPNVPPPLIVDFVTTEICNLWMSKYRYMTYTFTNIREITYIENQE